MQKNLTITIQCFCLDFDVCAASCYAKILFNVQPFKLEVVKHRNIDKNCGNSRAAGKYHRSLTWDGKETYTFLQSMCKCYVLKYILKNTRVISWLKGVVKKCRKFHFLV